MAATTQNRQSLLETLRPVFESRGYDGASLSQLAAASGLGKASLYHHFPGGKAEIAAALLRDSVAQLERLAFSKLNSPRPAADRLTEFVDGFRAYVQDGERSCLVLVLSQGSGAADHVDTIAAQYADWLARLTATCAEAGLKPKRAERAANELLAGLYGHLETARLTRSPERFRRHAKRLKKNLPL